MKSRRTCETVLCRRRFYASRPDAKYRRSSACRQAAYRARHEKGGPRARGKGWGACVKKTIEKARQRMETFPYKDILYENVSILRSATYRRSGDGRKQQHVIWDQRLIPDIRHFWPIG